MYRLSVHDYFSSAHQLKGYRGKCEGVHGHNWKVEVEVGGETLDDVGLLMDFSILKKNLRNLIEPLDHVMLNDVDGFRDRNPSSEHIARHIFDRMSEMLPAGVSMITVTVWESENAKAVYSG